MALCVNSVSLSLRIVSGPFTYPVNYSFDSVNWTSSVTSPLDAFVKSTTQTIDTCTTYILQTAQEYQTLPTLTDIFTMPLAEDLAQMWMIGFSLPMITYLTAWGYGVVINWFNEKHH